jgi:hypothetical protein
MINNKFKRLLSVWIDLVFLGVLNYNLVVYFGFTREFDFLTPWIYFVFSLFLFKTTFGKFLLRLQYRVDTSFSFMDAILRYKYYIIASLLEYLLNTFFNLNLLLVGIIFIVDFILYIKTGLFFHEKRSLISVVSINTPK